MLLVISGAVVVIAAAFVPVILPAGGFERFRQASIDFQLGAESPFSIWYQRKDDVQLLRWALALMWLATFVWPRRRTAQQTVAGVGTIDADGSAPIGPTRPQNAPAPRVHDAPYNLHRPL